MALTDAKIRAAKPQDKPYKLADSGNMFLLIHPNGSRYWRLRYRFLAKEKTLALGVYPDVTLSEARDKRDVARKLIADGIDPCEQKRVKKSVPETSLAFEAVTLQWHKSNKKWSESHSAKILKSFESHVFPFIGSRDITTLKTPDLLIPVKAAEAKEIYEIAARLQQRISAVMRYAAQSGIIDYNPAVDMAVLIVRVIGHTDPVHPELEVRPHKSRGRKPTVHRKGSAINPDDRWCHQFYAVGRAGD